MPRYQYRCSKCEDTFTFVHSMSEKLEKCDLCGAIGTLTKVYSTIRKTNVKPKKEKVGQKVKDYIEDTKRDVRREKERLKKEEYRPE